MVDPLHVLSMTTEDAAGVVVTDALWPRFGWVLSGGGANRRQTAYQVVVEQLADRATGAGITVWDSGRQASGQSLDVVYAGRPVQPRTHYRWRARVWDESDDVSAWSDPALFETAMLSAAEWSAAWIAADAEPWTRPRLDGAAWISPAQAPLGHHIWFRAEAVVATPLQARAFLTLCTSGATEVWIDETLVHAPDAEDDRQVTSGPRAALGIDVTEHVAAARGRHLSLAIRLVCPPGTPEAALLVHLDGVGDGALVSGNGWTSTVQVPSPAAGMPNPQARWEPVVVGDRYGVWPAGVPVSVPVTEPPAPLLRTTFDLPAPPERARLYASGLAFQELWMNGVRVGDAVLDPALTNYERTVHYVVHDVTELVHAGKNALGVELGRGFYGLSTPNIWQWHRAPWHAEPCLLLELVVDHAEGRTVVASGPDWRTRRGPTVTNSLYAGESFDDDRHPRGWTGADYDDSTWSPAMVVPGPAGRLVAQSHEPIRVVGDVLPVDTWSAGAGTDVVDFGTTLSGWCRITGSTTTGIRISYGELLTPERTVEATNQYVDPARFQVDEWVGGSDVDWEPRFSYKGFRYAQLEGLTSPAAASVTARSVRSDVASVSEFSCDVGRFEQYDRAMRRTIANNLHGLPTDTPMYEKNGWTGDAQVAANVLGTTFDLRRLLAKWLGDIRDSQLPGGQLAVIAPTAGWGYEELAPAPEWTTAYPHLLRQMHRWYGGRTLLAQHLDPVLRYLTWEQGRLRDGLAITALGDWLPPGYPGVPPEDTRLTATAYLVRAMRDTAAIADLLERPADAKALRSRARGLQERLNAVFLDRTTGHYRTEADPDYRQTSNAVPLAFGLVPADMVKRVVDSLTRDIRERGTHLNTGCLGTSVLLPVLSKHGQHQLAADLALQDTYPSWGSWFSQGADTMWEAWSADYRSRNHYFLGTVAQWLYENVAGVRVGDNGWAGFTVRPDARAGVGRASFMVQTVRGPAGSAWMRDGDEVLLTVTVPVGSTAEVHVPGSLNQVTSSPLVPLLPLGPDWVIARVGSGEWTFRGRDRRRIQEAGTVEGGATAQSSSGSTCDRS